MRVSETPSFVQLQQSHSEVTRSPLRNVLRFQFKEIVRLMLVFSGPTALFYLVVVFSLGYVTGTLGLSRQTGFAALMVANVCAVFGALAGGSLSDRVGRKAGTGLGRRADFGVPICLFPFIADQGNLDRHGLDGFPGSGLRNIIAGFQPVYFAEAFPTNVRYSGSALSYTAANLIAGATLPATAVWLLRTFEGSPWSIVAIVAFWNVLALAMVLIGPETRGVDLEAMPSDA